jgi:hypothetical protein
MLIELMPKFGLAAFVLILPMTGVILFVMLLVVLSYREVVSVYTRAGGSYVVARENFGPRIPQVAAVALLIDYVVTVAVQIAAGTAAVAAAFPALGAYSRWITITIIPFDVQNRLRVLHERQAIRAGTAPASLTSVPGPPADLHPADPNGHPADPNGHAAGPDATWPPREHTAVAAAPADPQPLPGAGRFHR